MYKYMIKGLWKQNECLSHSSATEEALRNQAGNGAGERTRKGLALFEIKFPLVAVMMTFYHPCSSPLFLVRLFSPFPPVVPFFISPSPLL
jgi:hypothetical protein